MIRVIMSAKQDRDFIITVIIIMIIYHHRVLFVIIVVVAISVIGIAIRQLASRY
jgi:hypothetical protein